MVQENSEIKDFERWVRKARKLMKTGQYEFYESGVTSFDLTNKQEGRVVGRMLADIRRIIVIDGAKKLRLFEDDISKFKYIRRCKKCHNDFISDADYDEICEICEVMEKNKT